MTYPLMRMRRLRSSEWVRELVAETRLHPSDLIMPLFICEGRGVRQEVEAMPGVFRLSIDQAVEVAKRCKDAGIKLIALFPVVDKSLKDENGSNALDPKNLMCRAVKEIKKQVPGIGVMVDVALDPYTIHGHDGVLNNGIVDNDATVEILVKKSVLLAQAGCDVVAPSDMMDGRVVMIREALESEELYNTIIMSYAAKYSSAFYGPFRDAVGSKLKGGGYLDKRSYQMDTRNSLEAMREVEIDESEGADMLIIKPGMPYLDVISKVTESSSLPVVAYQVSGEYAMMKFAGLNGVLDYERGMFESLIAFKRAGCRAIISYAALEVACGLL
jgi:porphobilinogen synthase